MLRKPDRGLYFHSDRGSQYSSQAVLKPLRVIAANLSMSGVGNCYDNAKAEAFFSTLKTECFPPNQLFSSKALARREIFEYIEVYYNNQRLHSSLECGGPCFAGPGHDGEDVQEDAREAATAGKATNTAAT